MKINFIYHGDNYNAHLAKRENDNIIVSLDSETLEKQFGSSLRFYVKNHAVLFNDTNKCHSDLFALNSSISRAIREQCIGII